jgi:hypothetical protein
MPARMRRALGAIVVLHSGACGTPEGRNHFPDESSLTKVSEFQPATQGVGSVGRPCTQERWLSCPACLRRTLTLELTALWD